MTSPGNSGDQPTAASGAGAGPGGATDEQHVAGRTRMGLAWVAAALSAVVLLLLLIFILENGQQVDIAYFGAHGHLPLGVALLLAAVLGILLVVIPGARADHPAAPHCPAPPQGTRQHRATRRRAASRPGRQNLTAGTSSTRCVTTPCRPGGSVARALPGILASMIARRSPASGSCSRFPAPARCASGELRQQASSAVSPRRRAGQ